MARQTSGKYRFRKHDSIGANDAENDSRFLSACFEDTGDLKTLADLKLPQRIVLGRTGSGKSALLLELKRQYQGVIAIEPESLSLNYISNSTIIRFLNTLGVNLDPFYKLLWRHVFAISLLQERYHFTDEDSTKAGILAQFFESAESKKLRQDAAEQRKKALAYLERWGGGSFWKDVDVRTKEITSRFETEIKSRLATSLRTETTAGLSPIKQILAGQSESVIDDLSRMSVDEKADVVHYAQEVVNEIQVKELTGMLAFLDEVLVGAPSDYYIVIDRLDENWVDDRLRYRLLKALVDTVREFGKVHKAKVIIALRVDLIESIFHETKTESGFQEEKYRSLYLPLKWSRKQLIDMLNKRVAALVRDQFTSYAPTLSDLLPNRLGATASSVDYILERTWMRPRDAIDFLNACIGRAEGKPSFTKEVVSEAEGEYSQGRRRSLISEWNGVYPSLEVVIDTLLKRRPFTFRLRDLSDSVIDDLCLNLVCSQAKDDPVFRFAERRTNGSLSHAAVRAELAFVLFRTGVIGIKSEATSPTRFADNESYPLSPSEINDECNVSIHPALWRALGISTT